MSAGVWMVEGRSLHLRRRQRCYVNGGPSGSRAAGLGRGRRKLTPMRQLTFTLLLGLLLAGALSGCATSPADQEATRKAWAARDAERAAECARNGLGFAAGGCLGKGP